ncbi:MAG: dicarboxylate/amino acid:cation symporter [Candidatus Malihini olakiniferum]
MKRQNLFKQIAIAIILGMLIGWACHHFLDGRQAKEVGSYLNIATDIFLRMIKMIIAPLVFSTLVSGLANMGISSDIGRVVLKAIIWFITASVTSLMIGMLFANLFQPGVGINLTAPTTSVATELNTDEFILKNFIGHIFPKSIVEAMANNEILQILVFSLFFGSALAYVKEKNKAATSISLFVDELAKVMFRITDYIMNLTPIAVFSALASSITTQGLSLIYDFGKLIGAFYIGLSVLWVVLFSTGYLFLGKSIFYLAKLIFEPTMLAFSTASSESAYPKTIEALNKFGIPKKISSFLLPLGYLFNLDGSMMYQSFAILFIAQAYNINLSIAQQSLILLTLMITSKGMAGVARASIVIVSATLPMFSLPEAGILLIISIDQFLDMGRTATNVVGNSISTAVVAKLEQKSGLIEDNIDK